jgi:hypothetical protein
MAKVFGLGTVVHAQALCITAIGKCTMENGFKHAD